MAERNDFMLGWISGWAAATGALAQSFQAELRGTGRASEMRMTPAALAETSGNKPMSAPRRRGRPRKSPMPGGVPKRRGRPPKIRTP